MKITKSVSNSTVPNILTLSFFLITLLSALVPGQQEKDRDREKQKRGREKNTTAPKLLSVLWRPTLDPDKANALFK